MLSGLVFPMESEKVKDLIIDVRATEVQIALQENHRLIELNKESSSGRSFTVGDAFLGKVKKVMPALNAAFVDIGDEKEAFIHYLDLGLYFDAFDQFVRKINPNTNAGDLFSSIQLGPILEKEGRIENVLKPGQMLIAQIVKEPISTKGSRLTAEISLAGRNIVLLPFAEKVSISQKIGSKEEKRRLETLVRSILPKNYVFHLNFSITFEVLLPILCKRHTATKQDKIENTSGSLSFTSWV